MSSAIYFEDKIRALSKEFPEDRVQDTVSIIRDFRRELADKYLQEIPLVGQRMTIGANIFHMAWGKNSEWSLAEVESLYKASAKIAVLAYKLGVESER